MEGLLGWVISSRPGPPPRQHKHERQHTPGTYLLIPTRRLWNDDYGGQIIFGDLVCLTFFDSCLIGEQKPREKPHPGNLSRPGIESGPAAWQARMLLPVPQRWTSSVILFQKWNVKILLSKPIDYPTELTFTEFNVGQYKIEQLCNCTLLKIGVNKLKILHITILEAIVCLYYQNQNIYNMWTKIQFILWT